VALPRVTSKKKPPSIVRQLYIELLNDNFFPDMPVLCQPVQPCRVLSACGCKGRCLCESHLLFVTMYRRPGEQHLPVLIASSIFRQLISYMPVSGAEPTYVFADAFLYGLQLCATFLSCRLHLAVDTFPQISAVLLTHLTHFFNALCLTTVKQQMPVWHTTNSVKGPNEQSVHYKVELQMLRLKWTCVTVTGLCCKQRWMISVIN